MKSCAASVAPSSPPSARTTSRRATAARSSWSCSATRAAEVALEVGERVRSSVAALDLQRLGVAGVSVSVGVAVARQADQPIVELIAEADRALYRAKRAGRDRVVAA